LRPVKNRGNIVKGVEIKTFHTPILIGQRKGEERSRKERRIEHQK